MNGHLVSKDTPPGVDREFPALQAAMARILRVPQDQRAEDTWNPPRFTGQSGCECGCTCTCDGHCGCTSWLCQHGLAPFDHLIWPHLSC